MAVRSSKKKRAGAAAAPVAQSIAEMKEAMLQIGSVMQEAATEARRADEIRQRRLLAEESETKLSMRIHELQEELTKQEDLVKRRELEIQERRVQSDDTRTAVLGAQLREQGERLRQKEAALREQQESSAARIRDLEEQIGKTAGLLESRDVEIGTLRAKLDELQGLPDGSVTLTEENVVLLEEVAQGSEPEHSPRDESEARGLRIGRSMRQIVTRSGDTAQPVPAPDRKKSRWASLLAPVKKGS
ncbi:MAG: hypothetical protein HYU47_02940 [Deltaproteobacteria bacterium]|nr:hypothetical protein [Deltaproteobacteria bacterium]